MIQNYSRPGRGAWIRTLNTRVRIHYTTICIIVILLVTFIGLVYIEIEGIEK